MFRRLADNRVRGMPQRWAHCKIPSKTDAQVRWEEWWVEERGMGGGGGLSHPNLARHRPSGVTPNIQNAVFTVASLTLSRVNSFLIPSTPQVTLRSAHLANRSKPFAVLRSKATWTLALSPDPHQKSLSKPSFTPRCQELTTVLGVIFLWSNITVFNKNWNVD